MIYLFRRGRIKISNRKKKVTISPDLETNLICRNQINYKFKFPQQNNQTYLIELSRKHNIPNLIKDDNNKIILNRLEKKAVSELYSENQKSLPKSNLFNDTKNKSQSSKNSLVNTFQHFDLDMLKTKNLFRKINSNSFSVYRNKHFDCSKKYQSKFSDINLGSKKTYYKLIFTNMALTRINESIENYNCFELNKKPSLIDKILSKYKTNSVKKLFNYRSK